MIRTLTSLAALALAAALSGGTGRRTDLPDQDRDDHRAARRRHRHGYGWRGSMARSLQQALGRPVVVENKPGAALALGARGDRDRGARRTHHRRPDLRPDGDRPGALQEDQLRSAEGFRADRLYVKSPLVLRGRSGAADQVGRLSSSNTPRRAPTPLTYSTPGAGAFQHLSTEFMAQRFGLKFTHVPYKSTPQSVTDIAAGHVNFGFAEAGASLPLIRGGKLRALAVSSTTRAADGARRAAVRGRRQRAGLRGGVLACPGRARGNAEGHRRSPA